MGHTVLSFLGATRRIDGKTGAEAYASVSYLFADGFEHRSIYSGAAVLARLRDQRCKLDRIVIFGTSGSQWDQLALSLGEVDGDAEEETSLALADRLYARIRDDAVTEDDLRDLEAVLRRRLGARVALRLMSRCETEAEALALIPQLVSELRRDRTLHVDVTNGFRHLPLLALFAALVLERVTEVRIGTVQYAMLAGGTGRVLDLRSVLDFASMAGDAKAFEASGDPSALLGALRGEGHVALAEALRLAAFYERTLQTGAAAERAREALALCEAVATPRAALFAPVIRKRLAWARDAQPLRDIRLAQQHLDNGDLAQAALLGVEAAVTVFMLQQAGPAGLTTAELEDTRRREDMRLAARDWFPVGGPLREDRRMKTAYARLRLIRNAIAHATPEAERSDWIGPALSDPTALRRELTTCFAALFGDELRGEAPADAQPE